MINEDRILALIRKTLGAYAEGLGDDCAVLPIRKSGRILASADMLVEGVDFDFRYVRFFDIGYKSIMVNLSDIAAMGGKPSRILVSLGIPGKPVSSQIRELHRGMKAALKETNTRIAGGDLSSAPVWTISVCVLGEARKRPKLRSEARPGHILGIAGQLGWSALGLHLLRNSRGRNPAGESLGALRKFISAHLRPQAQLRAGQLLGAVSDVGAMIDVSDGLSTDLVRICKASQCGAMLDSRLLPMDRAYGAVCVQQGLDAMNLMLNGGEDFALLFTCRPAAFRTIEKKLAFEGIPVWAIGKITPKSQGVCLLDSTGKKRPLSQAGFDHFGSNVSPRPQPPHRR